MIFVIFIYDFICIGCTAISSNIMIYPIRFLGTRWCIFYVVFMYVCSCASCISSVQRTQGNFVAVAHYRTEIVDLKALHFFLLDKYYASHPCHTIFLGFTLRYFRVTDAMHNTSLKLFERFVLSFCIDLYFWLIKIGYAKF